MDNAAERRTLRLLVVAVLLWAGVASADATAAEALFDEGRRLAQAGNYPAACAKFAESYRLDPAGGTLMNLAACHAHEGKTATAWSEFRDALARAIDDGRDDRVNEAKTQIAKLEPLLARVRIVVESTAAAGLQVRVDGTVLKAASFGVAIPIDPGRHVIVGSAPGHVSWHGSVDAQPSRVTRLEIPALEREVNASPSPRPQKPESARSEGAPAFAYVLGGVGIASIGVGTYFGLVARSKKRDSESECASAGCTRAGKEKLDDANRAAWFSNGGFAVGLGCLGVATYLFLDSGAKPAVETSVRIAPQVSPDGAGLGASGIF